MGRCVELSVVNIHERELGAPAAVAGELVDSLASDNDRLWPHDRWPAMELDRPLGVGAAGGHGGVIGYVVESYEPGRSVGFRFTQPKGFIGTHRFEVDEKEDGCCVLRHTIEMETKGASRLTWIGVVRPLHDALLEDALDRAAVYTGGRPQQQEWSTRVRALRWMLSRGSQ